MQRFELSKMGREKGFLKPAAFDLHQSSEFLYHCVLLVCNFYTPHVHNLGFLRTQAERLNMRLVDVRSEEHTSELQSLMRISYAVFCLKKKKQYSIHLYTEKNNNTQNYNTSYIHQSTNIKQR